MKIFYFLLIILFFNSNSVLSIDCPPKYKFGEISSENISKLLMEDRKLKITDAWKNLSSSVKQTCEILHQEKIDQYSKKQDKKRNLSNTTYGFSNFIFQFRNTPAPVLILFVVGVFILLGGFSNFIKFFNKNRQKKNEIVENKKKNKKNIITWDEPLKSEIKTEESVKKNLKPTKNIISSQEEEKIYEKVAKELKENRNEGVWLKAYTENDGDEIKTKIAYTQKRVEDLIDELKKDNLKN